MGFQTSIQAAFKLQTPVFCVVHWTCSRRHTDFIDFLFDFLFGFQSFCAASVPQHRLWQAL
jgi:hypothetical protein